MKIILIKDLINVFRWACECIADVEHTAEGYQAVFKLNQRIFKNVWDMSVCNMNWIKNKIQSYDKIINDPTPAHQHLSR